MKTQYLREFVVLSKLKNYNAAAEELFISQPTLSRHIKELEDELGTPLFTRSTRKVECTDYGLYFLPWAQKIIAAEDECLNGLAKMRTARENTLYIGSVPQIDQEISEIISAYSRLHPDVRFVTSHGESEDLRKELLEGNLDLIFIREPQDSVASALARLPLWVTPLSVVMRADHPLSGQEEVSIDQLHNEPLLMSEGSSLAYRLTAQAALGHGFELNTIFQGSRSQIINLVRRGTGITVLFVNPAETAHSDIAAATLTPHMYADICCVYDPQRAKERKQAQFISFIEARR